MPSPRVRRAASSTASPRPRLTVPNIEFKRVGQFSSHDVNSLPLAIDVNGDHAPTTCSATATASSIPARPSACACRWLTTPPTRSPRRIARNVSALLISETPGVHVLQPFGQYGRIDSGETDRGLAELPAAPAAGLRSRARRSICACRPSGDSAAAARSSSPPCVTAVHRHAAGDHAAHRELRRRRRWERCPPAGLRRTAEA